MTGLPVDDCAWSGICYDIAADDRVGESYLNTDLDIVYVITGYGYIGIVFIIRTYPAIPSGACNSRDVIIHNFNMEIGLIIAV